MKTTRRIWPVALLSVLGLVPGAHARDGDARAPHSTNCPGWGDIGELSSHDQMCLSGASETVPAAGALIRGGDFLFDADAAPFAVDGGGEPSFSDPSVGFRGGR